MINQLDPTILAALNSIGEAMINKALSLDPAMKQGLASLDQTNMHVHLVPPDLHLYFSFTEEKVYLSTEPRETDLRVSGAPLALGRLIKQADESTEVAKQLQAALENDAPSANSAIALDGIHISGDLQKAAQIRQFLSQLDLDWEAALASKIGDLPAHFIGQRIRKFFRWEKQAQNSLTQNLDEFVHQEAQTLPTTEEHRLHKEAIAQMAERTNHLGNRIKKLEERFLHRQANKD